MDLNVRVSRKAVEAVDIATFELVGVDGQSLPAFSAGSHVDVRLPGGLVRQYSLCNNPGERGRYLIGVLRDAGSRGGSTTMHDQVHEGDTLQISSPKNHFPLAHDATKSLLFAGGIGVTPILCMAERLTAMGASFNMHYCTRSLERTAFHQRIIDSAFASRVQLHFDNGPSEQKLDLGTVLANPDTGTHVYVCGPKGFMDAVLDATRKHSWPDAQVHFEFFASAVVATEQDEGFDVKLASSGRVIHVPKDSTVVQALAAAGVDVPVSCEQGVCGTCLTRVLEGEPDHRDMFLTDDEHRANDQFTPCCSRAKSRELVLDL